MSACRILLVAGARPNFMKIAPLLKILECDPTFETTLVHTGQHYDEEMSASFFADLGIREPDLNLGVGSAPHGRQTGRVMIALDSLLGRWPVDLVVVVGDVNSTVAAAIVAAKREIAVAHVEAGLRSGDRGMPEELNRIVTDSLSALCLTPSPDAGQNLLAEGVAPERIHFVGNIMIDSLLAHLERADASVVSRLGVEAGEYALVTLHRPSNVDSREQLAEILGALSEIAAERAVVFPVHPRTKARMEEFGLGAEGLWVDASAAAPGGEGAESGRSEAGGKERAGAAPDGPGLRLLEPVGYLEILALQRDAAVVLTDSGGIQEETTVLGVPCLTLRDTTERPITISEGTNRLVPVRSREAILSAYREALEARGEPRRPEGWDGRTAERIVAVFHHWWQERSNTAAA